MTSPDRVAAGPWRRTPWPMVGVLCLPVLTAAVAAALLDLTPVLDWSLIELRVRDVGTADTPLVGAYSRFGWNHPGPLLFYALALPYRLMGSASNGLLVGAGLVNAVALSGSAGRRTGEEAGRCWPGPGSSSPSSCGARAPTSSWIRGTPMWSSSRSCSSAC